LIYFGLLNFFLLLLLVISVSFINKKLGFVQSSCTFNFFIIFLINLHKKKNSAKQIQHLFFIIPSFISLFLLQQIQILKPIFGSYSKIQSNLLSSPPILHKNLFSDLNSSSSFLRKNNPFSDLNSSSPILHKNQLIETKLPRQSQQIKRARHTVDS